MSDDLPELSRPAPPPPWRDRLTGWAETLDLSPTRLIGGAVALAVVGFLGWRLLAPPPTPPEMRLPFVSTTGVAPGAAPEPGASPEGAAGAPAPAVGGAPTSAATGGDGVDGGDGGEVVVHVAGAVAKPGVQHLPAGSRVVDAVEAAGGAALDADQSRINLAAPLEDGQQVYVPRLGEAGGGAGPAPGGASGGGAPGSGSSGAEQIVNLNTADVDQLDSLPGIGPAIAQAIVDHRERNGPFASVDQLLDVRGIGEAKLADLRERVTV
jgi:competence protein ComEA